jgi:hypothetical protein
MSGIPVSECALQTPTERRASRRDAMKNHSEQNREDGAQGEGIDRKWHLLERREPREGVGPRLTLEGRASLLQGRHLPANVPRQEIVRCLSGDVHLCQAAEWCDGGTIRRMR